MCYSSNCIDPIKFCPLIDLLSLLKQIFYTCVPIFQKSLNGYKAITYSLEHICMYFIEHRHLQYLNLWSNCQFLWFCETIPLFQFLFQLGNLALQFAPPGTPISASSSWRASLPGARGLVITKTGMQG